jgi:putative tricarboxylic transport membrane protein
MNPYDQVYNIAWTVLAILVCIESIKLRVWGPSGPESGFVPFAAGLFIGVSAVLMFIFERTKASRNYPREDFWEHPQAWKRIVSVLLGFFGMAFLMPLLGFLLASVTVMIFLVRLVEPQRLTKVIFAASVYCSSIYVFFNHVLQIRLPKGLLPF